MTRDEVGAMGDAVSQARTGGRRQPRTPEHEARCREYAGRLIPRLRDRARDLGYALGVHGSLAFDIDLIAVPWSPDAVSQPQLAEALRLVAEAEIGFALDSDRRHAANPEYFELGCPGLKPHGRRSWTFHLGGGPYIDLAVMPPWQGDDPFEQRPTSLPVPAPPTS